uniref:Uncharacterized protein n=1 Tax=viral metagenome TaxID=1070528 RepID=A0A6C0JE62_9ZZZZ
MPYCKNDPTRKYKGVEPSPKGLGYCAHAEKFGTTKKGRDGSIWKVKDTKKNVLRWVRITRSKKTISKNKKRRVGRSRKRTNKVMEEPVGEPWSFVKKNDTKIYPIIDNGGISFAVYIKGGNVTIYKSSNPNNLNLESYDKLVKKYTPKEIFIGKDIQEQLSTGIKFPKEYKGSSILLKLKKNKYVFIGETIYEFETLYDIEKYFSHMGNSQVVYPVGIGDKNVYLFIEDVYMSLELFNERNTQNRHIGVYAYNVLYSLSRAEKTKYTTPIKKTIIHKRLF